ncbi:hypothetical protein SEPCBS57363_001332 [Sporothrix epigloea]|uniref:N-acetyltransferase ESCO zinc-finger domain-containing protein n=1 Tax=Sporothrix epigloea TaxID=1892477 RepID=A0ABP0DDF8_9PEZI
MIVSLPDMRYLTPDPSATRLLESPVAKRTDKGEEVERMPTGTVVPSREELIVPSAMPTPTPSPVSVSDAAAARKPARRAVRTYGKKRPLSDTSKGNVLATPSTTSQCVKRQKTSETDSCEENRAPTVSFVAPKVVDSMPGRLLEEADGAERSSTQQHKTPTISGTEKPITHPQKAGSSSRNQGIQRYFQSAATRCASATPPPPQPLQASSLSDPTCSPASSASSVPSLSPCPVKHYLGQSEDDGALTSPLRTTSERQPRQKRRLIIRPDVRLSTPRADDATIAETRRGISGEESAKNENDSKNEDGSLMTTGSSMSTACRRQLGPPKMLKMEAMKITAAKKRKKATGTVPVQTTLSLAIAGGTSASVKECKECNIVYNPLHDKDARFHARYHASACRRLQE